MHFRRLGDKEIVEDSEDKDNLRKGCIWKEEYVGNTAVSTCIFEGRPIQISGRNIIVSI